MKNINCGKYSSSKFISFSSLAFTVSNSANNYSKFLRAQFSGSSYLVFITLNHQKILENLEIVCERAQLRSVFGFASK